MCNYGAGADLCLFRLPSIRSPTHHFRLKIAQRKASKSHATLPMNSNIICGGCLCGSVRYEATGEPYNITHCHCLDCRRSSGAPFVTWASFPRSGFRFITGPPRELKWAGRQRSFCPLCGTQLTFLTEPNADEIDVTVLQLR